MNFEEIETVEISVFDQLGALVFFALLIVLVVLSVFFVRGLLKLLSGKSGRFAIFWLQCLSYVSLIFGLTLSTHFKYTHYLTIYGSGNLSNALLSELMIVSEARLLYPLYVSMLSFCLSVFLLCLEKMNTRANH